MAFLVSSSFSRMQIDRHIGLVQLHEGTMQVNTGVHRADIP